MSRLPIACYHIDTLRGLPSLPFNGVNIEYPKKRLGCSWNELLEIQQNFTLQDSGIRFPSTEVVFKSIGERAIFIYFSQGYASETEKSAQWSPDSIISRLYITAVAERSKAWLEENGPLPIQKDSTTPNPQAEGEKTGGTGASLVIVDDIAPYLQDYFVNKA